MSDTETKCSRMALWILLHHHRQFNFASVHTINCSFCNLFRIWVYGYQPTSNLLIVWYTKSTQRTRKFFNNQYRSIYIRWGKTRQFSFCWLIYIWLHLSEFHRLHILNTGETSWLNFISLRDWRDETSGNCVSYVTQG